MKKIKRSMIIALSILLLSSFAWANNDEYTVEPNFSSNTLTIKGKSTASEQMTIMILEDGTTLENYWSKIPTENIKNDIAVGNGKNFDTVVADPKGVVYYFNDFYTDANGNFSHSVELKETGVYNIYLYSNSNDLKTLSDITFTSSDDYEKKIIELKNAGKDVFITDLADEQTLKMLGLSDKLCNGADAKNTAEILYSSKAKDELSNDFDINVKLYKACAAIDALNKGKDVDLSYLDYAKAKNDAIFDFFDKYSAESEKRIIDYLKNKSIANISELTDDIKEIALLEIVKSPNGYENIKKAFENFKDITNISSPTSNNEVYTKLSGKSFNDISELINAYNAALKEVSSNNSSGGGSSGGSSGGKHSASIVPNVESNQEAETINKNIFDDLDSVPWASEAIINLAVKGVVNGKTESIFAPDDFITRQEFTKLVVAALVTDVEPTEIAFSDVDEDSWAYPYISKAKAAGIINGYSESLFGAEDMITRQDMSVIIYNAAKYKEVKTDGVDNALVFADDADISDYAKEAVYSLKAIGIVNGTDSIHFEPQNNATRAEAAVMIYRLLLK